jgi:hypothetical protein
MIPLFLGLTAVNLIGLTVSAVLGYLSMSRTSIGGMHFLVGALSVIVCCAVHCVVFTYFIATAKWLQHAIVVKRLDPELLQATRSFKAQAFPAAIGAMGIVFLAAVFGAATQNYGISITYHHLLAVIALAVNILATIMEFTAIRRNGRLIDDVLARASAVTSNGAYNQIPENRVVS